MNHHLILGGARSGKSTYAEQCALSLSENPIYIATAQAGDEEMQTRIKKHQDDRSAHWQLIEEPLELAESIANIKQQSVILVDCLTLWLSNCLHEQCWQKQQKAFLEQINLSQHQLILVSNEVGLGVIPMGALSRQFVDQSGWLHQTLAQHCERVTQVIAGLPQKLK